MEGSLTPTAKQCNKQSFKRVAVARAKGRPRKLITTIGQQVIKKKRPQGKPLTQRQTTNSYRPIRKVDTRQRRPTITKQVPSKNPVTVGNRANTTRENTSPKKRAVSKRKKRHSSLHSSKDGKAPDTHRETGGDPKADGGTQTTLTSFLDTKKNH